MALEREPQNMPSLSTGSNPVPILLMLSVAFLIRLIIAPLTPGHPVDFVDFSAWADHAYVYGLPNFYDGSIFADYPPGYIYILYFIGLMKSVFSLGFYSKAAILLVKLPAILADLAAGYLLYKLTRKSFNRIPIALLLTALYVFNPAIVLNSTVWAQIDSVWTLILLLMFQSLVRGQLPRSAIFFTLAFLFKPQTVIFAPLLFYPLIQQFKLKTLCLTAAGSAVTFIALILPFTIHHPPLWIIEHYQAMFAAYPYASLNAFNLYTLFGLNGAEITGIWLGLSYNLWGQLFTAALVILTAYLYFKNKAPARYYFLGLLIVLFVFIFKTNMHERYLYPALILALLTFISFKDKRLLFLFIGFSLTHYANVAYVFSESLNQRFFIPNDSVMMKMISFLNILLAGYTMKIGIDLLLKHKTVPLVMRQTPGTADAMQPAYPLDKIPPTSAVEQINSQPGNPKLTKRDKLLMTGLTLLYTGIALFNLGGFQSPETLWKPSIAGESFYVDLGSPQSVNKVTWFSGIGDANYELLWSDDAKTWKPLTTLKQQGNTVFKWQAVPLKIDPTRFIKLIADKPGGTLNGLAFWGPNGTTPIKPKTIFEIEKGPATIGTPDQLFDEPKKTVANPSFMNSAYFDEIYHARTAYEHLHLLEPYENTHPPLGKVLISLGVYLFGMNPFGWRFIGTLFGIAMIPLMYLFGKRIFKRSDLAFITAFLLTFDFMHFAQTRIATIDVYGVFFILLMYYFMYKYYSLNVYETGLKKSLLPLALSGLFFGIGVACKWIDLYAGAGLAILFFYTLYERLRERRDTKALIQLLKSVLWCGLFFIVVPAIVYVCSYIPFMMVPGAGHGLSDVIANQKHMLSYHKNLIATHPFSSSWWEWPFIKKPIWYYSGEGLPQGKISSIVSMGNPAVWWFGLVAILTSLYFGIRRRDKIMLFILIGLFSQYLPWVGVPRLTFIYHYFATVPFMIFCIVYVLRDMLLLMKRAKIWITAYLGLVLMLFILFYPILSGMVVSKAYVSEFLRWFPGWYFY